MVSNADLVGLVAHIHDRMLAEAGAESRIANKEKPQTYPELAEILSQTESPEQELGRGRLSMALHFEAELRKPSGEDQAFPEKPDG